MQVQQGKGNESQEAICRDYAIKKGYEVIAVFHERAVSGGKRERPEMNNVISFLAKQKEQTVILIDDISRFSRDIVGHFLLKEQLMAVNGTLEAITGKYSDDATGKFQESIMAVVAELYRNQNREQVMRRQKGRLLNGYWTFCQPEGLRYVKDPRHGKILVADGVKGAILKNALEMFSMASW